MAETYHILDYRSIDVDLLVTLIQGLPASSRLKKKLSGNRLTLTEQLLAVACDALTVLIWQKTKDGQKGRNKPKSLYQKLMGLDKSQKDELMTFDTPEKYLEWRKKKYG